MQGSILVIPSVSSGNIPQLAVDLLIHTLEAEFVEALDDRYVYPFVGPRDGLADESALNQTKPSVTTAVEAHYSPKHKLAFIQQRSPTLPGLGPKFVQETVGQFIAKHGFSHVVVLGSSTAALKPAGTSRIQLYSTDISAQFAGLHISSQDSVREPPEQLAESGTVVALLRHIPIPTGAVVMFAYEGDNSQDAEELAAVFARDIVDIPVAGWVRPQSWRGVYGREAPVGLEAGLYT